MGWQRVELKVNLLPYKRRWQLDRFWRRVKGGQRRQ